MEDQDYVRYWGEIDRYPLLSAAEEAELARRAREGDAAATEKLVTSNLRFVVKIAMEYRSDRVRILDLVQEGTLGLLRAVQLFDSTRGVRLLTYGVHWIRAYIRSFLGRQQSVVRRPERSASRTWVRDLSLAEPIGGDEEQTVADLLPDDGPPASDALIEASRHALSRDVVARALGVLGERERYIIHERFLTENGATLQEIGDTLGLSRERVRQLEARAKERLGRAIRSLSPELAEDFFAADEADEANRSLPREASAPRARLATSPDGPQAEVRAIDAPRRSKPRAPSHRLAAAM